MSAVCVPKPHDAEGSWNLKLGSDWSRQIFDIPACVPITFCFASVQTPTNRLEKYGVGPRYAGTNATLHHHKSISKAASIYFNICLSIFLLWTCHAGRPHRHFLEERWISNPLFHQVIDNHLLA
jgi:hypothetical protein